MVIQWLKNLTIEDNSSGNINTTITSYTTKFPDTM